MTLQCYDWGLWNVGHSELSQKKARSALSHSEHTFFYLFPQKDGCIYLLIYHMAEDEGSREGEHALHAISGSWSIEYKRESATMLTSNKK